MKDHQESRGPIFSNETDGVRALIKYLAFIAVFFQPDARSHLAADEQKTDRSVTVRSVAVGQQSLTRTTTQPAWIEPYFQAEIRGRISAYVREIKVDFGDTVSAGDVLAILDAPEMSRQVDVVLARIRRLEAEELRASAEVDVTAAGILSAESLLKQAESAVAMDEASLKAITAEYERVKDLVSRGSSEPRLLDEASRRRESAQASRMASLSSVTSAEANIAVAKARHASAEASLKAAQAETMVVRAELDELKQTMQYLQLSAPFAGIVTRRSIDPGDLIHTGSGTENEPPLFTVSRVDRLRCRIAVPERDAVFVRAGDQISLVLPSLTDGEIRTSVTRTSRSLDRETRTLLVEAEISNADGKLLPGMFGQATVTMRETATTSILPAGAVRFDADGKAFVYVIRDDDTVAVSGVTVISDDGSTLQLRGIEPGQRVIGPHLQRFSDGQKVKIFED